MSETVVDDILAYERDVGPQAAGTLSATALAAIADLAPRPLLLSVETGSGKSTVLLSNLSERHICFTLDDTAWYGPGDSSFGFVRGCPSFRPERTEFILGRTQRTLPAYKFDRPVNLALIDGPHGFPFPDLEYYYLYPHLSPGAVLVIDDVNIPTIGRLFEFVREDDMFELIKIEGFTAFLRRTDAPTFNPERDGWDLQRFNVSRVSKGLETDQITTLEAQIAIRDGQIASLEAQIAIREGQIASLETQLAKCNGTLNDVSMQLAVLRRSRLLKLGRIVRRLTRQEVPY